MKKLKYEIMGRSQGRNFQTGSDAQRVPCLLWCPLLRRKDRVSMRSQDQEFATILRHGRPCGRERHKIPFWPTVQILPYLQKRRTTAPHQEYSRSPVGFFEEVRVERMEKIKPKKRELRVIFFLFFSLVKFAKVNKTNAEYSHNSYCPGKDPHRYCPFHIYNLGLLVIIVNLV